MADTGRSTPTAMRRALGEELRRLRLAAELTVDAAAKKAGTGISDTKITQTEKARRRATRDEVLRLVEAYGGVDPEQMTRLLTMVSEGGRKEWFESRRLPATLSAYLGLERLATVMHAYDTSFVHGLLQIRDYAREVIRGGPEHLLPHEIEELVDARMRRQEALSRTDPPPLELWSAMDEAALRRNIGGPETMRAQLQYLIEVSELPNVNLVVIPNSLGIHPGLGTPFSVLQFEADTRGAVYVESHAGNLIMEKADDLRRSENVMTRILSDSPGAEASVALIKEIVKEMDRA